MKKPIIPIDELTEREFAEFKEKYLDKEDLSKEALEKISKLFAIGYPKTGRLCCDDYHPHSYKCNQYYRSDVGIIHRFIIELRRYQHRLEEIERLIK